MGVPVRWLACPNCKRGSVLNIDTFAPEPLLGDDVKGLPETIQHAYTEARKTFSFECYTACNLLCRKILMNVAVDKGAPEGKGFVQYIDYMSEEGHIANAMRQWVDKIKDSGNEATHKIDSSDSKSTETTLTFTTILLKNLYEAPFRMKSTSKEST